DWGTGVTGAYSLGVRPGSGSHAEACQKAKAHAPPPATAAKSRCLTPPQIPRFRPIVRSGRIPLFRFERGASNGRQKNRSIFGQVVVKGPLAMIISEGALFQARFRTLYRAFCLPVRQDAFNSQAVSTPGAQGPIPCAGIGPSLLSHRSYSSD